jgi:hypothetical protein
VAGTRAGGLPRQGARAGTAAVRTHALAGSRGAEDRPSDPRHASTSRGGREPAAPGASRQRQLAGDRDSSSLRWRGKQKVERRGEAAEQAEGTSVGPGSFVIARVDDKAG